MIAKFIGTKVFLEIDSIGKLNYHTWRSLTLHRYILIISWIVKFMLLSCFTFLQAVAISALNLNGLTPVTAENNH